MKRHDLITLLVAMAGFLFLIYAVTRLTNLEIPLVLGILGMLSAIQILDEVQMEFRYLPVLRYMVVVYILVFGFLVVRRMYLAL